MMWVLDKQKKQKPKTFAYLFELYSRNFKEKYNFREICTPIQITTRLCVRYQMYFFSFFLKNGSMKLALGSLSKINNPYECFCSRISCTRLSATCFDFGCFVLQKYESSHNVTSGNENSDLVRDYFPREIKCEQVLGPFLTPLTPFFSVSPY